MRPPPRAALLKGFCRLCNRVRASSFLHTLCPPRPCDLPQGPGRAQGQHPPCLIGRSGQGHTARRLAASSINGGTSVLMATGVLSPQVSLLSPQASIPSSQTRCQVLPGSQGFPGTHTGSGPALHESPPGSCQPPLNDTAGAHEHPTLESG